MLEAFPREVYKELPGPWISITPTLHKVIGHSSEVIERNDGYGLGTLHEAGMESCNKVLRNIRITLSRKCSQDANLGDVINRMWMTSDPLVNAGRSKHSVVYALRRVTRLDIVAKIKLEIIVPWMTKMLQLIFSQRRIKYNVLNETIECI